MEPGTLESLRAMLEALPKRQAETARLCWRDIQWDAERYREALAREESNHRAAPWEVERDLAGIAADMRDLAQRIQRASPDVLRAIENEANYEPPEWGMAPWHERTRYRLENPRGADPFPWFEIGRYSPQSDGTWEPVEPHWGHDGMRPYELREMADFLEKMAQRVGSGKAAPNGPRDLRPATKAKMNAKERLISSLDFELHWMEGRPKGHILPMVQTIHRWATGDPVGSEWGWTELERARKRMEEGIRRQEEEAF